MDRKTPNNFQFIVDEIPDQFLDEYTDLMLEFTRSSGCRFQYRKGRSQKYPLFPVNKEILND